MPVTINAIRGTQQLGWHGLLLRLKARALQNNNAVMEFFFLLRAIVTMFLHWAGSMYTGYAFRCWLRCGGSDVGMIRFQVAHDTSYISTWRASNVLIRLVSICSALVSTSHPSMSKMDISRLMTTCTLILRFRITKCSNWLWLSLIENNLSNVLCISFSFLRPHLSPALA